jgi:hypothetical protein
MAIFTLGSTIKAVETVISASAELGGYIMGEPKQPPDTGTKPYGALTAKSSEVLSVFADMGTRQSHVLNLRLYLDALAEPQENTELEMIDASEKLQAELRKDSTLNSTVMKVDPAGEGGTNMNAIYGYVELGGKWFRIADITVPFIVDDSTA